MERTLVILKPDAVERRLIGEVLGRFEKTGLDVVGLRRERADQGRVREHYPSDDAWLGTVGQKTLDDYERQGIDAQATLGTSDPVAIGKQVKEWLVDFLTSGDVVVAVVEGNRAIEAVRKIVGNTLPVLAAPGSIRGDFSTDSPDLANAEARPVRNLIHASGDQAEASRELALWFPELS